MSSFEVWVRAIDDVRKHPKADRLMIVKILGYEAVVNNLPDGSPRFKKGDLVVYVPEQAILPDDVLKEYGYWSPEKIAKDGTVIPEGGALAGKGRNRVHIVTLRDVASQGLIFPLSNGHVVRGAVRRPVLLNDDVAAFFDITKNVPPVVSGEVTVVPEMAFTFDIENWQNFPGFLDHDEVEATEKLHGTNFRICYHPHVSHPEMFGFSGSVGIASKLSGSEGKMFKNNRKNLGPFHNPSAEELAEDARITKRYDRAQWWGVRHFLRWRGIRVPKPHNYKKSDLYVRAAIENDLVRKIEELGRELGKRVDLFGEVFGAGVQKGFSYGEQKPVFRAFDIAVDRKMLDADEKVWMFSRLGVERVPVLYRGPWDEAVLIKHRDGKTTMGEAHIREGIVITAIGDQSKRDTPDGVHRLRPILKMVSPAYLKTEDGTEIQ